MKTEKHLVYAPYSETPIEADDILAEVGFVFSLKNGRVHVTTPWHIGDSHSWWQLQAAEIRKRDRFVRKYVRECYKLAKRMAKEEKAKKVSKSKGSNS